MKVSAKVLIVVSSLLICSSPALASPTHETATEDTPSAVYARTFGVSRIEADQRFIVMDQARDVQRKLRTRFPATFGGLYVQHRPQFRVVVSFTESPRESLRTVTTDPAFVALLAAHSLTELRAAQEVIGEELHRNGTNFLSELNLTTSTVEVYVEDPPATKRSMGALGEEASLVRFNKTSGFIEPTLLNLSLDSGKKVVDDQGVYCTTGFGVKSGSTRGITTAGHCSDQMKFGSRTGDPLVFQGEKKQGSEDIQWFTYPDTSRYHYIPSHRVEAGSQTRIMEAVRSRSDMQVGDFVCKYGKTTYETCGLIGELEFQATFEGAVGKFVRVRNDEGRTMTDFGDSGGPVYGKQSASGTYWNTAYGMVHGRGNQGTDFYRDLFFMPTDYFSSLGLQILTVEDDL